MDKISVVIITKNESANIKRCLESVKQVADEILVVDAFSEDHTVNICRAMKVKVIQKEWEGYAQNKNFGNEQAKYNHILSIDADEVLSKKLGENILSEKKKLHTIYSFNRLTNYCGSWIYHCGWYPDKKIRLFDKQIAKWETAPVHEKIVYPQGIKAHHIHGDLLHFSFRSLSDHIQRLNHYSEIAAQELLSKNSSELYLKMLTSPLFTFFKGYIIKWGFLDGFYGLCICTISAFDIFIRYAKAINRQKNG